MPGPAVPAKTRKLMDRIEAGDREAAFDLARLYRPDDLTDLVRFVWPDGAPPTTLFDTLADAYNAYQPATG